MATLNGEANDARREIRIGDIRWPFWTMLLYGHFGTEATTASLRADRRSRLAIGAFVTLYVLVTLAPVSTLDARQRLMAALAGPMLASLQWERWRYAASLGELARRLYLESLAIAYLAGLGALPMLTLLPAAIGWTASPAMILALEPLRATVLVWRSRRYA